MGSMVSNIIEMGQQESAKNIKAFQTGVNSYFATKTAKVQNNLQAFQAESQAKIAGYNADVIAANKTVQDIQNRQALDQIGRQISSATANYKETQGGNVAQAAAGNVDVSSGSTAAVLQGNANRYASDYASMRRAYDLQQWAGESTLAMMDSQIRGLGYQQDAYNKTASAYRSIANMQGSAWMNAIGSALISHATDTLTGKYGSGLNGFLDSRSNPSSRSNSNRDVYDDSVTTSGWGYYDRALQTYTSTPVRH